MQETDCMYTEQTMLPGERMRSHLSTQGNYKQNRLEGQCCQCRMINQNKNLRTTGRFFLPWKFIWSHQFLLNGTLAIRSSHVLFWEGSDQKSQAWSHIKCLVCRNEIRGVHCVPSWLGLNGNANHSNDQEHLTILKYTGQGQTERSGRGDYYAWRILTEQQYRKSQWSHHLEGHWMTMPRIAAW